MTAKQAKWERREDYQLKRSMGLCIRCKGVVADRKHAYCDGCLEVGRASAKETYRLLRRAGLCVICKAEPKPGYVRCERHLQSVRDSLARFKEAAKVAA